MPQSSHYTSIDTLPRTIPVFPLRGCILMPGATLPLNVFEPRYLAMLDSALRTNRLLGIIQPDHSAPAGESPEGREVPLRRIGGLGRLTAFQEQDNGRTLITLLGVARFEVIRELSSTTPYRIYEVDYTRFADDLKETSVEDTIERVTLVDALKRFFEAKSMSVNWSGISGMSSEDLVDAFSVAGPFGPEEKQALLEAKDAAARAEILIGLARMALAGGSIGASTKIQ